MDKKTISISLVTLVVAGTLGFFGGMKYAQSKTGTPNGVYTQGSGQRQQQSGQNSIRRMGAGQNGGFLSGEVLSKDDKSLTIKMRDNSTKIVILSASTSVGKATAGTLADLQTGQQVTVAGTANPDGSVIAQQIQIRPENAPAPQPNK